MRAQKAALSAAPLAAARAEAGNGNGLQAEHLTPAPADTGCEARLTGDGHTPRWSTAAAEPLRIARKPARDRPDRL